MLDSSKGPPEKNGLPSKCFLVQPRKKDNPPRLVMLPFRKHIPEKFTRDEQYNGPEHTLRVQLWASSEINTSMEFTERIVNVISTLL